MITRIYADNYKCFSNFEYKPGANELLLGRNGSGKSSVFEVLRILRSAICPPADKPYPAFHPDSLTRWDDRTAQRFELDVSGNGGSYRYEITIQYPTRDDLGLVNVEALWFTGGDGGDPHCLFRRDERAAQFFSDDYAPGPQVDVEWSEARLSWVQPRRDNRKLTWFKDRVASIHCAQLAPGLMASESSDEQEAPTPDLSNYASWYRHLAQEEPHVVDRLKLYLREVIDGFDALTLQKAGERMRWLVADFRPPNRRPERYGLSELSDGQQVLIGLYTLAAYLKEYAVQREKPTTLCIDEPENFVALSELQPWIREIEKIADGENAQVLIASHHPEFIDYYAGTNATLFYREHGGPVRTKPFTAENADGLMPSELVARGWEDE